MKEKGYPRWNIHRNEPSFAEKFFMKVLNNNNIEYQYELNVKNNNNHNYILDFFIEKNGKKIDLEIDGKQHDDADRKIHDSKRDAFLQSKNYIVYRIKWNDIKSQDGKLKMKEKIDNFLKMYSLL